MPENKLINNQTNLERSPSGDILQCRHHWIIESPAGPTSRGQCKKCGDERYFINSTADWVSENTQLVIPPRKL